MLLPTPYLADKACHGLEPWHASILEIMEFHENELYHIYNRGNNKQQIFFSPENYIYFLNKIRRFILPCCEILSYALMPNHFHFMIYSDLRTVLPVKTKTAEKNVLSEGFRNLLSSYAQAINKQRKTTGSLFQQNTRAKCLRDRGGNYAPVAFHYLHQNPMKSGLVGRMEDWPFSSFRDYAGLRNGTLCNKSLAFELLDLNEKTFYEDSYIEIKKDLISKIL